MEWWLPFAVVAAALAGSMIAPLPRPRRRDSEEGAPVGARRRFEFKSFDDDPTPSAAKPARAAKAAAKPAPQEPRRPRSAKPTAAKTSPAKKGPAKPRDAAVAAEAIRGDIPRTPPKRPAAAAPEPPPRGAPVTDRPGVDAPSYFRDPASLQDWPQAASVEDAVRVFLDRWGGEKAATTFRRVEVASGTNERAFVFLLAVEPQRGGKETTLLARVSVPGENVVQPCRFKATKYFDHMGERFREDVSKTPQHSRGVIVVRDVPPGEDGRGAVALDFEAPLKGDPYDDIRAEDVTQYKNLLNILRMFA